MKSVVNLKPKSLPNPAPIPQGWPRPMKPEAMHGLLAEIVETFEPYSEADPAGLALQTLVAVGNMIGSGPHFMVESDRHALNLFLCEVGPSAKGRKGVGWGNVQALCRRVDQKWVENRIHTGLRTGEGLISQVKDASADEEAVADKRLLLLETELGGTLRVMGRYGNTLSPVLRQAWDGGMLAVATRKWSLKSTNPHISMIAQTTKEDLSQYLTRTDILNGFTNRFIWANVRRSKLLPQAGSPPESEIKALARKLAQALKFAQKVNEIPLSDRAATLWTKKYPELTAEAGGLLGAATSRAEPMVRRLAALYAVMNQNKVVMTQHLQAALAVWDYSADSARFIFSGRETNAFGMKLESKLVAVLRQCEDGLTRTEIRSRFSNHFDAETVSSVLENLKREGLARSVMQYTAGRPAERWFAVLNEEE